MKFPSSYGTRGSGIANIAHANFFIKPNIIYSYMLKFARDSPNSTRTHGSHPRRTVILIFIAQRTSDLRLISAINGYQFQWTILNHKNAFEIFSTVGIATGYGLNDRRVAVRVPVGSRIFSMSSGPALGPTQPPIQWVPKALSPGVKRPGLVADHSAPTSAEVKKTWIYTSTPPLRLRGVVINYLSTETTARGATFRYGGGQSDPFRLYRQTDRQYTFLTETPLQTSTQLPPLLQLRNLS
jgi:hypothetical protein